MCSSDLKIKAELSWDFTHGDSTFVVGVVDSGVDYTHEDLQENLAYNYDDPINGVDDDTDGYIDNYYGWDFGSNDHDPMVDGFSFAAHGSTICGIIAASTDNEIGTSSSAFNCRYLPVKITNSSGQIIDTKDRKSTRLNSSHKPISYAVFCLKKKKIHSTKKKKNKINSLSTHTL